MRVLVVHHGSLAPTDAPTSGGALRAATHIDALRAAGHEVRMLSRAQDVAAEPPTGVGARGFRSPSDLRRMAAAHAPDWILCVAQEEAPALRDIAPLVVDLYAPRPLEAAFEGAQHEVTGATLAAIDAADEVMFSNPRQRWFFLGLLAACGWDVSLPVGRIVPLAALRDSPPRSAPSRPRFVVGGAPWPWQDARATLTRAVAHLKGRADVVSFGLPAVEGVDARPRATRAEWLAALAGSTAALDRYAPNSERALALSFRQMDYLACGLPLLTDADTPLAEAVLAHGAGWVGGALEDALDAALMGAEAEAAGAARLAEAYRPERTEAPLLSWTPARRERGPGWLRASARLARSEARAQADRVRRVAAEAEVAAKRAEVDALHTQVRALTSSVESLSAAVADVAGFRREAVAVLGARLAGRDAEGEHLRRELEILRADLDKKTRELESVQVERDRVGGLLRALRGGR